MRQENDQNFVAVTKQTQSVLTNSHTRYRGGGVVKKKIGSKTKPKVAKGLGPPSSGCSCTSSTHTCFFNSPAALCHLRLTSKWRYGSVLRCRKVPPTPP